MQLARVIGDVVVDPQGREPRRHHAAGGAADRPPSARPSGRTLVARRFGRRRRRREGVLRARQGSELSVLSRRAAGRRRHRRHRRSLGPRMTCDSSSVTADAACRSRASSAPSSSTQKHRKFEGAKLLLVQPLTLDDTPRGAALLAVDGSAPASTRRCWSCSKDGRPARRSAGRARRSTPRSSASSTRSTCE